MELADMRDLGSRAAMRWGSSPHARTSVVASFVSLATAFFRSEQTPSRTHSAAPPFQIEPAALGFNLGFFFWGKVRSASFPATAYGYCRKLRLLPCASSQIRSPLALDLFFSFASYVSFATAFFRSEQTPSRTHSAAPPFQIEPAALGFNLGFYFWGKVRSASFTATAEGYCRKLRSLPCPSFQIRSTWLRICFFLFRGLRIVRDDDFSFRTIVIAHSLRRSSFPN